MCKFRQFVAISIILFASCLIVFSCEKESRGKKNGESGKPDVYFNNPAIRRDWPDPTVWYGGDCYYSAATGIGTLLQSDDMVKWTVVKGASPVTSEARTKLSAIGGNFWAPDVVKIGDKWMMYVTCYNSREDCGIAVLSSDSPSGPFEYVGAVTHSKKNSIGDTIDPEVVVNPENGDIWMFFGSTDGIHRVRLNDSGTALAGGAAPAHVAGLKVSRCPDRSKVFEGAYLHNHGGYWYLFVSSGNYWDESYMIKVGRSRTLDGDFLARDGSRMANGEATIILSSAKTDSFYGPGHNGEIFTDATGQDYIFYHCHDRSIDNQNVRRTHLQRIYWDEEGWPFFKPASPTSLELAPKL